MQSVMKASPGTEVLMPWQHSEVACFRSFVPGFDD
jgi:hypothetical protein